MAITWFHSMGLAISPPPPSSAPRVWRSTIAMAPSLIPTICWALSWSIPTTRKSSRWRPNRSSRRTPTPRTTANASPPVGERPRILGNPSRRQSAVFQLDHRLAADARYGRRRHARRSGSLEDRERNLQHAEKSRLQPGTQLWPRRQELVGGAGLADDARFPRRPNPAMVLSFVPGRLEEAGKQ